MSLVLRGLTGSGAESTARISLLPLIAAVAVAETLSDELGEPDRVALKWPNDVWIDRRKVAGVLVEGRSQENWAVLGIGVNVTTPESGLPASLRTRASSLAIASKSGSKSAPEPVLAALLDQLERWLAAEPAGILEAWRARDGLRGSNIRWSDGEGRAAGVDDTGALLVRTPEGMVRLTAGEVSPGGSTPAAT